jgi:hypothetical protein
MEFSLSTHMDARKLPQILNLRIWIRAGMIDGAVPVIRLGSSNISLDLLLRFELDGLKCGTGIAAVWRF